MRGDLLPCSYIQALIPVHKHEIHSAFTINYLGKLLHVQGAPIKNDPLEKILYPELYQIFSPDLCCL